MQILLYKAGAGVFLWTVDVELPAKILRFLHTTVTRRHQSGRSEKSATNHFLRID